MSQTESESNEVTDKRDADQETKSDQQNQCTLKWVNETSD